MRGAGEVADRRGRVRARSELARPVLVDGLPGVLVTAGGRPVTIRTFTIADGAITAIRALTASNLLAQVVPPWVA